MAYRRPLPTTPSTLADVLHEDTCLGMVWRQATTGCMRGEAGSPFQVGHLGEAPLGGGLRAIPDGLPAATHNTKHPGGRVTCGYMSGHGLAAGHSRVHAW